MMRFKSGAFLIAACAVPLVLNGCQTVEPTKAAPPVAPPVAQMPVQKPLLVNADFKLWPKPDAGQCAVGWTCSQHAGPPSYKFSHDKIETKSGIGVADGLDRLPGDLGDVDDGLGGYFTGDDRHARGLAARAVAHRG